MDGMDWTELRLTVSAGDTDRAADIANMAVPYGLYIEDYSDLEQGARERREQDGVSAYKKAHGRLIELLGR